MGVTHQDDRGYRLNKLSVLVRTDDEMQKYKIPLIIERDFLYYLFLPIVPNSRNTTLAVPDTVNNSLSAAWAAPAAARVRLILPWSEEPQMAPTVFKNQRSGL